MLDIRGKISAIKNQRLNLFLKETWSKKNQLFHFPFNSNFQVPSRANKHCGKICSYSLEKDQIINAVYDILPWAQACIESGGGAFEYKLKSVKKRLNR